MIPKFDNKINNQNITITQQPSFTYKYEENHIAGYVDEISAIEQTILHIVNCERYENTIYGEDYGIELKQFHRNSYLYFANNIESVLKSALTQDDRIDDIIVIETRQESIDSCYVKFKVITNTVEFETEVNVNV